MEVARLIVFSVVTRAVILWASVAIVARGNPRNGFGRALIATAILIGLQSIWTLVIPEIDVLLVACWALALFAVLMIGYRLRLLPAALATVLGFAGWVGTILLFDVVRGNEVAQLAYLTLLPGAIVVVWLVSAVRSRSSARAA